MTELQSVMDEQDQRAEVATTGCSVSWGLCISLHAFWIAWVSSHFSETRGQGTSPTPGLHIDAAIIYFTDWREHLKALGDMQEELRVAGLTTNPKCALGYKETQYLVFLVGGGQIKFLADKVHALRDYAFEGLSTTRQEADKGIPGAGQLLLVSSTHVFRTNRPSGANLVLPDLKPGCVSHRRRIPERGGCWLLVQGAPDDAMGRSKG